MTGTRHLAPICTCYYKKNEIVAGLPSPSVTRHFLSLPLILLVTMFEAVLIYSVSLFLDLQQ